MNILKRLMSFSKVYILRLPKRRHWIFIKLAIVYDKEAPEENGIGMFLSKAIFVESFCFIV